MSSESNGGAAHTPLPWDVGFNGRSVIREVPGMSDSCDHYMVAVLSAHSLLPVSEAKANTALIVRAVNTSPAVADLVKALEFYATARRYEGPNQHPIPDDPFAKPNAVYIQDVTRDNGDIARSALSRFRELEKGSAT